MRIMIVQYAGDFREAYDLLQATGEEVYYGHRYIFEQLESIRKNFGEVAFVCCLSPSEYREVLPNGVTVFGAKAHPRTELPKIRRLMEDWNPTHLIVLGPLTGIIRWGVVTNRRVMCQMADSFEIHPLVRWLGYGRLVALLNDPRVGWVSNHGVNACRSLARIGVDREKLIAWDWPYSRRPDQTPARAAAPVGEPSLLYVGSVQTKKGVGDVIAAVARLKARGRPIRLKIAGGGQIEAFRTMARSHSVENAVEFLGMLPNSTVFQLMKTASAVVVPSRHEYPEGLPLTIYEALCARTPIVASDHPMFANHLVDRKTAMVFKAKDVDALASSLSALLDEPELYAALSRSSEATWTRMQNPVKWGDILHRWLSDRREDRAWLHDHRFQARPDA